MANASIVHDSYLVKNDGQYRKRLSPNATNAIKAVVFVVLLALTLLHVQSVLGISEQPAYTTVRGFKQEREGSLDAVYFGASNVHALWQPAFGWLKSGIAVRSYSLNAVSGVALKNMIIEARKTQPDTLCIVNLNSFKKDDVDYVTIHRTTDYMVPSANKLETIKNLTEEAGYEEDALWEYLFPLIRFHSRWSETKTWDYYHKTSAIGTNRFYGSFLQVSVDISPIYHRAKTMMATEGRSERLALEELVAYLKETKANVLFFIVPQALTVNQVRFLNGLEAYVEGEGFPCLDLLNGISTTKLSLAWDFKDDKHTNVHGSVKFSRFLTDYLVENYGFTDKRGQAGWEEWDQISDYYKTVLSPYALPFELDFSPRSYAIKAPELELTLDGGTARLSWTAVRGTKGYQVYRKIGKRGDWELVCTTNAKTRSFAEPVSEPEAAYTYTVVPVRKIGGELAYGNFPYYGVTLPTSGGEAASTDGTSPVDAAALSDGTEEADAGFPEEELAEE